jgi:exonuclease III
VRQTFVDEFGDLLERLATLSAPLMIVGNFNIHFDDPADVNTAILSE